MAIIIFFGMCFLILAAASIYVVLGIRHHIKEGDGKNESMQNNSEPIASCKP